MLQDLPQTLKEHFSLHLSRAKCMSEMIKALIKSRNVQLQRLSEEFSNHNIQLDSHRVRIQRFLKNSNLCPKQVAQLIAKTRPDEEKWILALDRTNWKFGKHDYNLLTLSIVISDNAIPLFVTLLDKKGNSDTTERVDLIQQFIQTFGTDRIAFIAADREFIGEDWVSWLCSQKVPFVLRSRCNIAYKHTNGGKLLCKSWFRRGDNGRTYQTNIGGHTVNLSGKYLENGELLAVLSSPGITDPLDSYKLRWGIECSFKSLKSSGFNLEMTHIRTQANFVSLLQVVFIAFSMCIKVGECHQSEIPYRRTVKSRLYSIFRFGLDIIARTLKSLIYNTYSMDYCFFVT